MTVSRSALHLLGATALAAAVGCSPAADRRAEPRVPAQADTQRRPAGEAIDEVRRPMDDSTLAAVMQQYVIMWVRGDTATFMFATADDSAVALADLGLIRAGALLDTATRVAVVADDGTARLVGITSRQRVDSAVRFRIDGCSYDAEFPVRDLAGTGAFDGRAFVPGMVEVVPGSRWRVAGSDADRELAIALARRLPPRGGPPAPGPDRFANAPFVAQRVYRFTVDDVEFLLAEVKRSGPQPADSIADDGVAPGEQRIFIAERPASDPAAPFQLAWWHRGLDGGEHRDVRDLEMLLKLGPRRLLTFTLEAGWVDDGAEIFLVRVAPGTWREAASYYQGC